MEENKLHYDYIDIIVPANFQIIIIRKLYAVRLDDLCEKSSGLHFADQCAAEKYFLSKRFQVKSQT